MNQNMLADFAQKTAALLADSLHDNDRIGLDRPTGVCAVLSASAMSGGSCPSSLTCKEENPTVFLGSLASARGNKVRKWDASRPWRKSESKRTCKLEKKRLHWQFTEARALIARNERIASRYFLGRRMTMLPPFSVVVPAFNEAGRIGGSLA